jgi:hypothetical protein
MTKVKLIKRVLKGEGRGYLDFQKGIREDYLVRTILFNLYCFMAKGSQSCLVGGGLSRNNFGGNKFMFQGSFNSGW